MMLATLKIKCIDLFLLKSAIFSLAPKWNSDIILGEFFIPDSGLQWKYYKF